MPPRKFIAHQERRIGRSFSAQEVACVNAARDACHGGKRAKTKAMWAALRECLPAVDFARVQIVVA
jgi:hypothetical protein